MYKYNLLSLIVLVVCMWSLGIGQLEIIFLSKNFLRGNSKSNGFTGTFSWLSKEKNNFKVTQFSENKGELLDLFCEAWVTLLVLCEQTWQEKKAQAGAPHENRENRDGHFIFTFSVQSLMYGTSSVGRLRIQLRASCTPGKPSASRTAFQPLLWK